MTRQSNMFWLSSLAGRGFQERERYDFVTKGLNDKITLHTYDADLFFAGGYGSVSLWIARRAGD